MNLKNLDFDELEHLIQNPDVPFPDRPEKPILNQPDNVEAVKRHAENLEEYKRLQKEYNKGVNKYDNRVKYIFNVWQNRLFDELGDPSFSENQHQVIYEEAYQKARSEGLNAIRNEFHNLVLFIQIFQKNAE